MKFKEHLNESINYRKLVQKVNKELIDYNEASRFIMELLTDLGFYEEAKKVNDYMKKI